MVLRWYYHLSGIIENILHGGVAYGFNCIKTKGSIHMYTPMSLVCFYFNYNPNLIISTINIIT